MRAQPERTVDPDTGTERWHIHAYTHREDGPAVKYPDGTLEWWVRGRRIEPPVFEPALRSA